jgi:hypothetical protein
VPTSGAPSAPSQDADLALLDDARTALSETLDLVRATRRRHRPLRGELGPLAQAHRRHLEVLAGAGRESSAGPSFPPVVPPRATAALAAVAQQERRLQVRLVRSAGEAGSGELARLLASISASCAQHVAAFPEGP